MLIHNPNHAHEGVGAMIVSFSKIRTSGMNHRGLSQRDRRRRILRNVVVAGLVSSFAGEFGLNEAPAVDLFVKLRAKSAKKAEMLTLEEIAALVDETDRELQMLGRVTVKTPDVWGQNRLTAQRAEYERLIGAEVNHFELVINGYKNALDAASASYEGRILQQIIAKNSNGTNLSPNIPAGGSLIAPNGNIAQSTFVMMGQGNANYPFKDLKLSDTSGNFPFMQEGSKLTLANQGGGNITRNGIGLEPSIYVDQKSEYIKHVQQLIRNNMGDDKTDMPGYGLYLMRMPVSVLPGSNTMRDSGAMITAELKHNLTGDLLQPTVSSIVVREAAFGLADEVRNAIHNPKAPILTGGSGPSQSNPGRFMTKFFGPTDVDLIKRNPGEAEDGTGTEMQFTRSNNPTDQYGIYFSSDDIAFLGTQYRIMKDKFEIHDPDVYLWLAGMMRDAENWLKLVSQNDPQNEIFSLGKEICMSFKRAKYLQGQGAMELIQAKKRLFEKYVQHVDFDSGTLQIETNDEKIRTFAVRISPEKEDNTIKQEEIKQEEINRLEIRNRFTMIYAYFIFSAMIDEQIKEDIVATTERQGFGIVPQELQHLNFGSFQPGPDEKARFTDYVSQKWPIQVFGLDPSINEQNEVDALSRKSDLQVALAQSLATGTVQFDQAMRYARRLEEQYATVGLNRTAVAFSAGSTTFGWKFYPRLQNPPRQNNAERLGGLIFNGGPSPRYDLAHRKIEPGPRECVALVVAPNFIPSIRMTTTTNWFDLTPVKHHGNERINNVDMIRLGRQIQMARNAFQRLCDDGNYRPGDLERLQDRITQLENMLPTQSVQIQLPFEGDWYGRELFMSDGARLSPRLLMWFGEPGQLSETQTEFVADPADKTKFLKTIDGKDYYKNRSGVKRSIFLIGQNLSITETRVVVGGIHLGKDQYEMISRNIIRVEIPDKARSQTEIREKEEIEVVDIHVATPNGVSNHLYVQLQKKEDQAKPTVASGDSKNKNPEVSVASSSSYIKVKVNADQNGKIQSVGEIPKLEFSMKNIKPDDLNKQKIQIKFKNIANLVDFDLSITDGMISIKKFDQLNSLIQGLQLSKTFIENNDYEPDFILESQDISIKDSKVKVNGTITIAITGDLIPSGKPPSSASSENPTTPTIANSRDAVSQPAMVSPFSNQAKIAQTQNLEFSTSQKEASATTGIPLPELRLNP